MVIISSCAFNHIICIVEPFDDEEFSWKLPEIVDACRLRAPVVDGHVTDSSIIRNTVTEDEDSDDDNISDDDAPIRPVRNIYSAYIKLYGNNL